MAAKQKTTYELLLEKYGRPYVPLVEVADYFGITDEAHLRKLALKRALGGVRAFKLRESRDSPLLVGLENLADELDRKAFAARD